MTKSEPAELSQKESILSGGFPLNTGFEYRGPDGRPRSDVEAEAIYQAVYEEFGESADPALLPQEVFFGVAASRYGEVLAQVTPHERQVDLRLLAIGRFEGPWASPEAIVTQ